MTHGERRLPAPGRSHAALHGHLEAPAGKHKRALTEPGQRERVLAAALAQ